MLLSRPCRGATDAVVSWISDMASMAHLQVSTKKFAISSWPNLAVWAAGNTSTIIQRVELLEGKNKEPSLNGDPIYNVIYIGVNPGHAKCN